MRALTLNVINFKSQLDSAPDCNITGCVVFPNAYYRSDTSGNWNNPATWQVSSDQVKWFAATVAPDFNVHTIVIRAGHKVNVTRSVTIDETSVEPGGNLVVTNAVLTVLNGGLTIQSNALGTGKIGTSTGSIAGDVTVERYIVSKPMRRFSFITAPVTSRIDTAWQRQIHITGTAIGTPGIPCSNGDFASQPTAHENGFDATASSIASMYRYDQTLATSSKFVHNGY